MANAGTAINQLQDFIAQARTFHARVDAIVSAMASDDPHAIAARPKMIAELADIVKRYEHLQA